MVPETRQSGRVELYRCASFPNHWELCDVLLDIDGEGPGRLPATIDIIPGALNLWL